MMQNLVVTPKASATVVVTYPPLGVLLVEAQSLARHSLSIVLTQGPYGLRVVSAVASCTEALLYLPVPPPDLILFSWPLAIPEGLPQATALLAAFPQATAVILADTLADAALAHLIACGLAGCLPKHLDPHSLPPILRSLQQGAFILPAAFVPNVLTALPSRHPKAILTARERDIVKAVGQGLTNNQIAYRLALSPGTVRIQVSHLLSKLGLANRTQLALYAQRLPR